MLQNMTYIVFLIIHMPCVMTSVIESFYGVRTDAYPRSSCHKIASIESAGICLGTCGILMNKIVMISHDKSTKTCMCSNDISGSDIIGSNWKTFVPPPCATGYVTYDLTSYLICLRYIPVPVTYQSAKTLCQAEGADLIKIDSQEKYDIFKDYHVPIANSTIIQVWVQGEKVGQQWQFHDGSPMPNFCPISMINSSTEIRLQAYGTTIFTCVDTTDSSKYHYLCEHYRVLANSN